MKKRKKWLDYGGILCLFLTFISLAIAIAINFRPLYVFDIKYLNILDYTTLGKEQLLVNYDQLLAYLNHPFQQNLTLPNFLMSASGLHHFHEVKQLFLFNYTVFLVTIGPSSLFLWQLRKEKRVWRLVPSFQIGMAAPVFISFFMLMGFDRFFIVFHELLFRNDDWMFNPATDPIINVLPEQFFMHSFGLFFIVLELLFASVIFSGKQELRKN